MKPILCLDFDGVLHSYTSGWQGARNIPDPPVPGALEFVARAPVDFRVHILSSRSHQWGGRRAMKRWLRHHYIELGMGENVPEWWMKHICAAGGMEPWKQAVDDATDMLLSCIGFPLFKPSAMVTIDDRAVTFTGQWPELQTLRSFKPWNKATRAAT